jgi:hypothetical protein
MKTGQPKDKQFNLSGFLCLMKYPLLLLIATFLSIGVEKSPAWALTEIESGECLEGEISPSSSTGFYTFYGEAGQAVVITATRSSGVVLDPEIILYAPDGTPEVSISNNTQARIEDHTLSMTGWYTIVVKDDNGADSGSFNLCLIIIPGATSKGQIDSGQCKAGTIDYNMESYTFYGEAGQAVVITATRSIGIVLDPEIILYTPAGMREISISSNTQALLEHTLSMTGWYTIVVEDDDGSDSGSFNLCLIKFPSTQNPIVNISPPQGKITGIDVLLQWEATGAVSFDLYFGSTHPVSMIANDISATEYVCPMLNIDTLYFWHVVAKYPGGNEVSGPYGWFFVSPCECDLNNDGSCNILDYQQFIQDWGRTNCGTPPGSGTEPNDCECDLNTDGKCNILDYQTFIQDWGRTDCPIIQ